MKRGSYDGGVGIKWREIVKGEGRVILILFMNGWFCVKMCIYACVCVFVNGAPYCISVGPGHLPFPLLS